MRTIGILSGIAASAIWGGMYVVSKVVMDVIPPFTLLTMRLILGLLILGFIVILQGGLGLNRRQFLQVLGVGCIGFGISIGFQFVGTQLSNASNGSLVTCSVPAFILFFATLILRERITLRRLFALGISTVGVLVVIDLRNTQLTSEFTLGNLSLVAASITWALYSVLIRYVTRTMRTLPVTMVAFIGGLCVTIPLSAWEITVIGIGDITPGIVWGVLYLGIISTAVAMFLWNYAFALLESSVVSITLFAQPIVGAGLGALLLGEQITSLYITGGILIGIGIWLAAGNEKPKPVPVA